MIVGSPTILNLVPGGVMKCVHVNQVNKNIEIQFKVMNGAAPYNVPEGVTCTIRGTKGDAFGYAAEAAVTAGSNVITVTLTEQLTAVAGAGNIFELVFVGAADDMKVSTENFILAVERQAMGEDTVISDSDLSYAEQVLDQLQNVAAVNAQVQQNKSNLAAEISRAKAAEAAETAARQAADNTLQSNINAEASTRAAQDASLQSQINQLVAPEGSAPSAAEVENARVGADGTVYPTLGDAIRTQDTQLKSAIRTGVYEPINFEIGVNRYISNGTVAITSNAKRASTEPAKPHGSIITIIPTNGYSIALAVRESGVWRLVESSIVSSFSIGLQGAELYYLQASFAENIPSDSVPACVVFNLPEEIKEIPNEFAEDLVFEIGIGRYISGTNLNTTTNSKRASVAPFSLKLDSFKITPLQDYIFSVFVSPDGTTWHALIEGCTEATVFTYQINGFVSLAFVPPGGTVVPNDAVPVAFEYVDFLNGYKAMRQKDATLELVVADVNTKRIWEVGGIGSRGEDTNRDTRIRMWKYLHTDEVGSIKNNSVSQIYVAYYDNNAGFVSRSQYAAGEEISLLNATGALFRVEILNVAGDINSYDDIEIVGIKKDISYGDVYFDSKRSEIDVIKRQRTGPETNGECAFKALVISDVHQNSSRFSDVIGMINEWGTSYFDALLNCGDTVRAVVSNGVGWHDALLPALSIPYINVIGNHDAWSSLNVLGTSQDAYNAIIAPIAERGGIVQPTGAATNGLNYYYRDFQSVRVIALDCMFWNAEEAEWLETILADALTNDKAVICMSHYGFATQYKTHIKSLWREIDTPISDVIPVIAAEKVSSFISNGGTFVAWFVGHVHGDNLHVLDASLGHQLVVTFPSMATRATTILKSDDSNAYNYNCSTFVSVDTYSKTLRLVRIGADIDTWGVKHEGVSLNYETGELIAAW